MDDSFDEIIKTVDRIIHLRDYEMLNLTIASYKALAALSFNESEVIKMMRVKEKWVGIYTSRKLHFGATTTQRVEGAHSAMKHGIETSGSLTKSFNSLDRWLRLHYEELLLQYENESINVDPLLTWDDKNRLKQLLGKVSQFALNKIKNELLSVTTYKACLCELRVNYNIPCRHILPLKGPIELYIIPKRWLLLSDQNQIDSNDLIEDISSIEFDNSSLNVPETKLSEIKIPEKITGRGRPSGTKRLPIAIEKMDAVKKKKKVDKRPLNSRIPANDIDQIYNPKSDDNCGFRALAIAIRGNKENWVLVKLAMNGQLNKRMEIYKDWLGYNINSLKRILESRASPCSSSLWFLSPDCAQLAADTFLVPIAIFDEKDEQCSMFFPLESAPIYRRNPIILHFVNSNHVIYVGMKSYAK
ncbi:20610_t:CDS:2, partial [Gigaspora margarita]